MPQLKNDLSNLKSLPNSMIEESANIQEIINVYQTLEKHNRTELIDLSFIQEFYNKLTEFHQLLMREAIFCQSNLMIHTGQ